MSDYWSEERDELLPLWRNNNGKKPVASMSERIRDIVAAFHDNGKQLTTVEVESRWHRGQATIGEMRQRGYLIETDFTSKMYTFIGSPSTELLAVTKTIQDKYYATQHWKATAKKRKAFDEFNCVQCHIADRLETHHWRYNLFAEDVALDLVTLCNQCHQAIHETVAGSSVHFPARLSQEMIDRIEAAQ